MKFLVAFYLGIPNSENIYTNNLKPGKVTLDYAKGNVQHIPIPLGLFDYIHCVFNC